MKLNRTFNRCLVIVPHEDDEINIAANTIYSLREAGTEVFIAFATNGDWKYPAEIRAAEAEKAARIIGNIPADHLYFLGYGDSFFSSEHTHMFYREDGAAVSKSGHSETYGPGSRKDYAAMRNGKHSPYNQTAFCRDLFSLIQEIRADLIICSDYDEHPDHRMLTLCFDQAMGKMLKQITDYHPIVLKAFAYCTAYCAVKDFNDDFLAETQRPVPGITEKYVYDIIGRSIYQWDERVSLSTPAVSLNRRFSQNMKARALAKHASQGIIFRAERIINADEVFWQRRTDSISYAAEVTASSGKPEYLNDYRLYNVRDIDSEIPQSADCLWVPDQDDTECEFTFRWSSPQTVKEICLYGDMNRQTAAGPITVTMDNGYTITGCMLPEQGHMLAIRFEPQRITGCTVKVPPGTGIAECEFYDGDGFKLADLEKDAVPADKYTGMDRFMNKVFMNRQKLKTVFWKAGYVLKYQGAKAMIKKICKKITGR